MHWRNGFKIRWGCTTQRKGNDMSFSDAKIIYTNPVDGWDWLFYLQYEPDPFPEYLNHCELQRCNFFFFSEDWWEKEKVRRSKASYDGYGWSGE
jgi:hypothetical protein